MALSKITNLSITDDTIVNADVNSSAAIALSKLATDPSNATNLASGTVPTARLGSGTASSSTVLYGDQTYKAEPGGGKILQVVQANDTTNTNASTTNNTFTDTVVTAAITPASTSNKIFVSYRTAVHAQDASSNMGYALRCKRAISGGATTDNVQAISCFSSGNAHSVFWMITNTGDDFAMMSTATGVDSPSASTEVTYTVGVAGYNIDNSLEVGGMYSATWSMVLMEIEG